MTDRETVYAGSDLTEAEVNAGRRFALEKPSPSYLQRKMQIPYSHAVRLIELFEAEGIISTPNSAGLRTVRTLSHPSKTEER